MSDRELDFAKAEADINTQETSLLDELKLLEQAAAALHQRLLAARAQLANAERAGLKNEVLSAKLQSATIPALDLKPIRDRALAARAAALSAREDCNRQLRHQMQDLKTALSALSQGLMTDEPKVEQLACDARAANMDTLEQSAEVPEADDEPLVPVGIAKRAQERVKMQAAIDVASESNFYTGFSTNLSDGGIFIATPKALPIGTEVDVSFQLPNSEVIHAHGVVRWVGEVTGTQTPGMGVEFTKLEEKDRQAIHAFIATRPPLVVQG